MENKTGQMEADGVICLLATSYFAAGNIKPSKEHLLICPVSASIWISRLEDFNTNTVSIPLIHKAFWNKHAIIFTSTDLKQGTYSKYNELITSHCLPVWLTQKK